MEILCLNFTSIVLVVRNIERRGLEILQFKLREDLSLYGCNVRRLGI